jgi:hypothetical protein
MEYDYTYLNHNSLVSPKQVVTEGMIIKGVYYSWNDKLMNIHHLIPQQLSQCIINKGVAIKLMSHLLIIKTSFHFNS